MSQFESSEIMVNYALTMQGPTGMRKNAIDERLAIKGLADTFGPDLALAIGAGVLSVIKTGGIAGAGSAAVAAVLGGGPIAIGLTVLGIGIGGYSIIKALGSANNELLDLIDKIEDLDYDGGMLQGKKSRAADMINRWISELKRISGEIESSKKIHDFSDLESSEQIKEKSRQIGNQLALYGEGLVLIKNIKKQWYNKSNPDDSVRNNVSDWGGWLGDIGDFEQTLDQAVSNYQKLVDETTNRSSSIGSELLKNTKGSDTIMKDINVLFGKIKAAWGAPIFDDEEKRALKFGKTLGKVKSSAQDVSKYLPVLIKLRNDLTNLLSEAEKRNKRGSKKHYISKRAVSLPATRTTPKKQNTPVSSKPISKRFRIQQNDVVGAMQDFINSLGVSLDAGAQWLNIDSKYGPNTAKALGLVLGKIFELDVSGSYRQLFKRGGVPLDKINDWVFMNKNPSKITRIARELKEIVGAVKQLGPNAIPELAKTRLSGAIPASNKIKQQQMQPQQQLQQQKSTNEHPTNGRLGWGAYPEFSLQNPSDNTIINALQNAPPQLIGGSKVNLYDFGTINRKMSDAQLISMIRGNGLFKGMAPNTWPLNSIPKLFGKRFSVFGGKI